MSLNVLFWGWGGGIWLSLQTYPFSNFGGVMMPQVPVNYAQNVYAYQVQVCTSGSHT